MILTITLSLQPIHSHAFALVSKSLIIISFLLCRYDDITGVLVLNDPWGRNGAAHVLNMTYADFEKVN